nr:increased DNA methylation 1-like [Tanacetum cinerariifolium]
DDTKSVVTDVKSTNSSDYVMDTNDDYCSFCNDTDSDLWLCCACACQICHQGQPSSLTKEGDSKDNDLIKATKRSNFEGFYTAVLEKNDEIITVVILRVHGYKVAEIPFVATTSSYRGLGMCRILMDEVETMIRGLGVERIMLPACTET